MMLTNLGLVDFVKNARDVRAGYVYGTTGQILTEKILASKLAQYPNQITQYLEFIRKNYIGKVTYDCVGIIKAYIWRNDDKPDNYDAINDVSANGMFQAAKVKDEINTIPDIPGICVRFDGHIGVYVGGGKVIEARGTKYGVVETELKGRGWTHWLECPYITYIKQEGVSPIVLKIGSTGDAVVTVQRNLNAMGSKLDIDGVYGPKTEEAVKRFQSAQHLNITGALTDVELRLLFIVVENKSLQSSIATMTSSLSKIRQGYAEFKEIMEG
jgi:hypothetical protein